MSAAGYESMAAYDADARFFRNLRDTTLDAYALIIV